MRESFEQPPNRRIRPHSLTDLHSRRDTKRNRLSYFCSLAVAVLLTLRRPRSDGKPAAHNRHYVRLPEADLAALLILPSTHLIRIKGVGRWVTNRFV